MGEPRLGEVVSTHPTENGRRTRTAVVLLVLGVLGTGIGIPLCSTYVNSSSQSGPSFLPGAVLGIGLAALAGGIVLALGARRSRDEVIVLHTGGIVLRQGGTAHTLLWADVLSVSQEAPGRGALAALVGRDIECTLGSAKGDITFTGWTRGAAELATAVRAAVQRGGTKSRWEP